MRRATRKRRRGDAVGAFHCTARAAQNGDPVAQFSLGLNYLAGNDIPPSVESAAFWLERAARGGHADAMAHLAKLALRGVNLVELPTNLFSGQTSGPHYDQAFLWARKAASGGSTDGMIVLAALLFNGPELLRDRDEAFAVLEKAAASGSGLASLSLALMLARMPLPDPFKITGLLLTAAKASVPVGIYLSGVAKEFAFGCPTDMAAAVDLYRRAAELGVQAAQTRIGCALLSGNGTPCDLVAGETWLRKAAAADDAWAASRLGAFHACGGGQPNFAEAGVWFIRAAELGDATAARIVAFLHMTGTGLYEDRDEASRWLTLAEQIATPATNDVAALLTGEIGDPGGPVGIRGWFEPQATSGDCLAAYRLAVCYAIGLGGARDDQSAVHWLLKASAQVGAAQLMLGQMLLNGRGASRDETAARIWIERAAEAGLMDARVALAELLANGRGGEPDLTAAFSLFLEASRQGHRGALYAVGVMYYGGHGIKSDRALAQDWFRRGAAAGHQAAKMMVDQHSDRAE